MGNTVSAAESIASGITHATNDKVRPPHHRITGTPPPECPMHQKEAQPPQPAVSECPIIRPNDNSDVNPYNMVSSYFLKAPSVHLCAKRKAWNMFALMLNVEHSALCLT